MTTALNEERLGAVVHCGCAPSPARAKQTLALLCQFTGAPSATRRPTSSALPASAAAYSASPLGMRDGLAPIPTARPAQGGTSATANRA